MFSKLLNRHLSVDWLQPVCRLHRRQTATPREYLAWGASFLLQFRIYKCAKFVTNFIKLFRKFRRQMLQVGSFVESGDFIDELPLCDNRNITCSGSFQFSGIIIINKLKNYVNHIHYGSCCKNKNFSGFLWTNFAFL